MATVMKNKIALLGWGLCLWVLMPDHSAMAAEARLHIPPLFQERPSWCWAAVGEMLFKYYDVPAVHRTDYQCGIILSRNLCKQAPECLQCDPPISDERAMITMIERYPPLTTQGTTAGAITLTAQLKAGSLSEAEVKAELDRGRPIIVGLSPTGFKVDDSAQHMALIIGYDESAGYLNLTVNDPFPFEDDRFMWIGNPYPVTRASGNTDGQYEIEFERFHAKLRWTQTIYGITCTGQGCPPENLRAAGTSSEKTDGDVMQTVLASSSDDFKALRTGHKAVDAETGTTWLSTVTFSGAKQCLVREPDDQSHARWSCMFKFDDRSEADQAVKEVITRLRASLLDGWIGTDLDMDSDAELYTRTDRFSAENAGSTSTINVYMIDTKKDGRVKVYLSVDNN